MRSWLGLVFALSGLSLSGCGEAAVAGGPFQCSEQGIRDAVAQGGGPHKFDCDGPTTVTTEATIDIGKEVILDGEGNLRVDGNDDHAVFSLGWYDRAELIGFTITGGRADIGGGIGGGSLTLTRTTVSGNTAGCGGGVSGGSHLTLRDSTVSGNTAAVGGGICNDLAKTQITITNSTLSNNRAEMFGGGIHTYWADVLTMTNSTLSGNLVVGNEVGEDGGGIYNQGSAVITNSTLSENTAGGVRSGAGGGIANTGTLTLINSTVSGNTAARGSGLYVGEPILVRDTPPEVSIMNTLVDGTCVFSEGLEVASASYSIESSGDTCGFTAPTNLMNVSSEDLRLGPLDHNNGPTETRPLLPGSIAIDLIPERECVDYLRNPLATDQRGVARPQGNACDVGAFELAP